MYLKHQLLAVGSLTHVQRSLQSPSQYSQSYSRLTHAWRSELLMIYVMRNYHLACKVAKLVSNNYLLHNGGSSLQSNCCPAVLN